MQGYISVNVLQWWLLSHTWLVWVKGLSMNMKNDVILIQVTQCLLHNNDCAIATADGSLMMSTLAYY